jgi:hypothetical protein
MSNQRKFSLQRDFSREPLPLTTLDAGIYSDAEPHNQDLKAKRSPKAIMKGTPTTPGGQRGSPSQPMSVDRLSDGFDHMSVSREASPRTPSLADQIRGLNDVGLPYIDTSQANVYAPMPPIRPSFRGWDEVIMSHYNNPTGSSATGQDAKSARGQRRRDREAKKD